MGPMIWTSGDVCPGFQSQGGSPRLWSLSPVCNRIIRFTFGATPADILTITNVRTLWCSCGLDGQAHSPPIFISGFYVSSNLFSEYTNVNSFLENIFTIIFTWKTVTRSEIDKAYYQSGIMSMLTDQINAFHRKQPLVASMAAKLISFTYLWADIGGAKN